MIEPSPEAADVEKIARECAHELHILAYIIEPSDEGLVNILAKYLAQARAPLVEALEDIAWGGNKPVDELRSIAASAVLTGTVEKGEAK